MAQRRPCPRCGWPTAFGVEVRRSDNVSRYVCLPCIVEIGNAQMDRREQWLADNDAFAERLRGDEDER